MSDVVCDISAFAERDIDIWLSEELRFNALFCRWFLSQAGVSEPVEAPARRVRVSVIDDAGRESDVEALFRLPNGGDLVLLVEDKIKAIFQPEQMEDYVERMKRGIAAGKWAQGRVAVFAPSYRALTVPENVAVICFGDAVDMLGQAAGNDRARYRADFLRRANQPASTVAEASDPATVAFWLAVDDMVRREFRDCFLTDRQNFPRQTWINPRWSDMPPYLRLDLKGAQGQVDLAFRNFPFAPFAAATKSLCTDDMELIEHGKSSALRIGGLAKFNVHDGLPVIDQHVKAAYAAASRLIVFWRTHRLLFDGMSQSKTVSGHEKG